MKCILLCTFIVETKTLFVIGGKDTNNMNYYLLLLILESVSQIFTQKYQGTINIIRINHCEIVQSFSK